MHFDYTHNDAVSALASLGIPKSGILLMHSDISRTGFPHGFEPRKGNLQEIIFSAVREAIGEEGTLLVPTFSYSFCDGEIYDPLRTPAKTGAFNNWLLRQPGTVRSLDPLFSLCAAGPAAEKIFSGLGNSTFDPHHSVYAKLIAHNAFFLAWGFGSDDRFNTLTAIHFAEQQIPSPHRFNKIFTGDFQHKGNNERIPWIYSVRVNIPHTATDGKAILAACLDAGIMRKAPLGTSFLVGGWLKHIIAFFKESRIKDKWAFLAGPPCDLLAEDVKRTGKEDYSIRFSSTDLTELAEKLHPVPRHLVSDGYDASLAALAKLVPLIVHEFPTGFRAFSRLVPERWICRSAELARLDGTVLFSGKESPLRVASYSLPKTGIVDRAELFRHLHTDCNDPTGIPFITNGHDRDWGLCCSQEEKRLLHDDFYRVTIDSDFSIGTLKVGEFVLPGKSRECITFCVELGHSAQFNAGLSGTLAGVKLFEKLQNKKELHYTYRLLIFSGISGLACWIIQNQKSVAQWAGCIFLDMLATGIDHHTLVSPYNRESSIDTCIKAALEHDNEKNIIVPYLDIFHDSIELFQKNDIDCPVFFLARVSEINSPLFPYINYHTHKDDIEHASFNNMDISIRLLEKMVNSFEVDIVHETV